MLKLRLHHPFNHTHNENSTKCCLLCCYGPSSLPLPPLCLPSVDLFCVSCGPHPGSGGSASARLLSTHPPPSSLRVCASSVRLWLQDLACLCFEALASVTLSVPLRLFQVPVLSLFSFTGSNQFNQRRSASRLLSPCTYVFSAPVRKDCEALLCVLQDLISSVSSSLNVLMVF